MKELWFWRSAAAIAVVGFLASRWLGAAEEPPVTAHRPEIADARPVRSTGKPAWSQRVYPPPGGPMGAAPKVEGTPDAAHVPPGVLDLAREQVLGEERARRDARSEQHYQDLLDTVQTFSDDHHLTQEQHDSLEDAITASHDRLKALRDTQSQDDGLAPPDRREAFRASFDQLDQDVRAAVGDDLAAEFHDVMRPPGGPGGGPGRDFGPPPPQ